ncbi:hypothetical protein CANCADRAFT_1669 [Tortispora caseinolytica NRRL Y-17796]|uniref:Structural maintenance of chromosomes protein 5 n=1 Tax=Tortispora caseinolytica NRRL Y-17796 TaxID=767744 RepID=A0A1E4TDV6_9ASCO|nr:hypothetical protein CANCADRAFT_1669 [Tortispora caseinolytica NRRL Y-17796]
MATDENFAPGSIVQISLTDFVTYSAATFRFSPNFNMIIGPNGTGKSTVVCGIHLGLGGRADVLGRAKSEKEFIKRNCNVANINLVIRGREDNDIVINRKILQNGNEWSVNGKNSTKKAVVDMVASLGVQTDNLCQFLPQDRVADFAQMTPVDLLRRTEESASQDLAAKHDTLIGLHAEASDLKSTCQKTEDTLKQLELDHERQRIEVDAFHEYQSLKKQSAFWSVALSRVELREMKTLQQHNKQHLSNNKLKLKETDSAILDKRTMLEERRKQLDSEKIKLRTAQNKSQTSSSKLYSLKKRNGDEIYSLSQASVKLTSGQQEKDEAEKTIALITDKIVEQDNAVKSFEDFSEQEQEISNKRKELDSLKSEYLYKIAELKETRNAIIRDLSKSEKRKTQLESEIASPVRLLNAQLGLLEKYNEKYTAQALKWLNNNTDEFQGNVFAPPLISASWDNNRARIISSLVNQATMVSFVCENQSDFEKFSELVLDQQGYNVNLKCVSNGSLSDIKTPCDTAELQKYGFDCWAIDLIEAPTPVKVMLAENSQLSYTAVSFKGLSREQLDSARQVKKDGRLVFRNIISGNSFHQVKISSYGKRNAISSNFELRDPRPLIAQCGSTADVSHMHELETQREELNDILKQKRKKVAQVDVEIDKVKTKISTIDEELNELKSATREISLKQKSHKRLIIERNENIKRLKNLKQRDDSFFEREREKNIKICNEATDSIINVTKQIANYSLSLFDVSFKATVHEKIVERYRSECNDLEREIVELKQTREHISEQISELHEAIERMKQKARAITQKEADNRDLLDQEDLDKLEAILAEQSMSRDVINKKLQNVDRLLRLKEGNVSDVIDSFKAREERMDELRSIIANLKERDAKAKEDIETLRAEYETEVLNLVESVSTQFSDSMKHINCVGEVRLEKDEDYAKWKIVIMVKFRPNEALQPLTGFRQSGGERAVSTIYYLMALQGITRVPFRLVDEINQGMDPRNERLVHKRFVDLACDENSPQYFLITPKLLSDLEYHPKMMVHCIFSGSTLLDNDAEISRPGGPSTLGKRKLVKLGDLRRYVKKVKAEAS